MFNSNVKELEQKINVLIQKQYESDLEIPDIKNCTYQIKNRYYNLDKMKITFKESKEFNFM